MNPAILNVSRRWQAIAIHPVPVGIALWAFLPLGLVLLGLNPALRNDRRWWAASAVWTTYLFFMGGLPLIGSRTDATVASTQHRDEDGEEDDSSDDNFVHSDAESREAQAQADKVFTSLLAEGDSLWLEKDTKPDAVEKYVFLLDTFCGHGKGSPNSDVGRAHNADLARVAVRAIDSLVESGNIAAAKKLIVVADEQRLTLVFRNPKSDALVPKARAENDQKERELGRDLERMQQRQESDSSDSRRGQKPADATHSSGSDFDGKCLTLASKVRPGMSFSQVTALLGQPDETDSQDLGELNAFKAGITLTIAKWFSPSGDNSTIVLGFENSRLKDGGTGGYSIVSGLHSAAPPGSSKAERQKLQNAVRGLGISVDE